MPVTKLAELAQACQNMAILERLGLTGEFWELPER